MLIGLVLWFSGHLVRASNGPRLIRSADNSAVYYATDDGRRYAFPNESIYHSWYSSFADVQFVSAIELAQYRLAGVVLYHPNTLIKLTTDPKVYVVGDNGSLRWITTEAVMTSAYGAAWATQIHDLSEGFFFAYHAADPSDVTNVSQLDLLGATDVHWQSIYDNQELGLPLPSSTSPVVSATAAYNMGSPTLRDIWVDPANGDDGHSGASRTTALKTVSAAWNLIPSGALTGTGYRIQLMRGTYRRDGLPNYWENKQGTQTFPIVLNAVDGGGTVVFQGDINAFQLSHFYLLNFNITPVPAGDAFHCEQCSYVLIRGMIMNGGDRQAHDLLKVNQSQYFYIENSDVSGADDNAIDFVAVQYGHVINTKISNAQDWCMYTKGGSAYLRIEGNEIFHCGTGGYTAGQGTGFEFMVRPWLTYEAMDIEFVNNVIHDTDTAGMGVNGGLNILMAYNTLVRTGTRDHFFEANQGRRGCDGDTATCSAHTALGGWGKSMSEEQFIPNKNVYVYNNLFYAPSSTHVPYPIQVAGPVTPPAGVNLTGSQAADENLQIKGNVFSDGSVTDWGLDDSSGCKSTNTSCNLTQLSADNTLGAIDVNFANISGNDFHITNTVLDGIGVKSWPAFDWTGLPTRLNPPIGAILPTVSSNRDGSARLPRAGAY